MAISTYEHSFKRELGKVAFGNCSVAGSRVAVAAGSSSSNSLALIDMALLQKGKSSLCSTINVAEPIHFTRWIHSKAIACATGNGALKIFSVEDSEKNPILRDRCTIHDFHADKIRGLAVHPYLSGDLAAGGYDQSISVTDLAKLTLRHCIKCEGVVGSIKWRAFLQGAILSCTIDSGLAAFYDLRQNPIVATTTISTGKKELFAHERIDNFGVLLGYGDGELRYYDVRNPSNAIASVNDPAVTKIGSIEMNDVSQAIVTSGCNGYSVWKVGKNNVFKHHAHIVIEGANTCAVFYSQSQILASTSLPSISCATFSLD